MRATRILSIQFGPASKIACAALILAAGYSCSAVAQTAAPDFNLLGDYGCQFHANDYFAKPGSEINEENLSAYLALMDDAVELETALIQQDITNDLWTNERAALLLELANTRLSLGDQQQARSLFENALLNMRVNRGVYSADQLPVILDLMAWYMSQDEEYFDELGDRAAFLYEKTYSEFQQIPELVDGYRKLLELRQRATANQAGSSQLQAEKAKQLGEKIHQLMEALFSSSNPAVIAQLKGNRDFFTAYDDYGRIVNTPQQGFDQVSQETGEVLEKVEHLLREEGDSRTARLQQAAELLDGLTSNYSALSFIDRAAVQDFLADYYLAISNTEGAITAYENILAIRVLRPDYQLRTLRALGQLYEESQSWHASIAAFSCWRQLSQRDDPRISVGLAHAHQALGNAEPATEYLEEYLQLLSNDGQQADKNIYLALKDLYYEIGNREAAAEITRQIVTRFD